jgi:lysophospholipase L1-like esterase
VIFRQFSSRAAAVFFAIGIGMVAHGAEPFELKDGDRVVLVGATFIEREGRFGYIETALTLANPDKKFTFRNLGWSGDTVWADSRGIFDPPAAGYQRMIELIKELKPTVIVFNYGLNESYAGESGINAFVKQYDKLCDDVTPTGARLAFMTPLKLERPESPLPDASLHNPMLEQYVIAIRQIAARRGAAVIELFDRTPTQVDFVRASTLERRPRGARGRVEVSNLTENGIHFSPLGYSIVANWVVGRSPLGARDPEDERPREAPFEAMKKYEATFEQVRQKVVAKNELFFYRWRPQNITYLTGFRKHEQGNNAAEIAQFDPLVEKLEAEIDGLKTP